MCQVCTVQATWDATGLTFLCICSQESVFSVVTVLTDSIHIIIIVLFITQKTESEVGAVKAVEDTTSLTDHAVQEVVIFFITLDACCQVETVQTVCEATGNTRFSFNEIIKGLITEGTCGSIKIIIIGLITVQAVG